MSHGAPPKPPKWPPTLKRPFGKPNWKVFGFRRPEKK